MCERECVCMCVFKRRNTFGLKNLSAQFWAYSFTSALKGFVEKNFFFFFFWLCCPACGILIPQPGMNLCLLQGKHGVLTTGLPGKSWNKHLSVHLEIQDINISAWKWFYSIKFSNALAQLHGEYSYLLFFSKYMKLFQVWA